MEISPLSTTHTLARNSRELTNLSKEIASGKKLFQNNPAGGAIAARLLAESKGLEAALRNTEQGGAQLNVAQGGLSTIQDSLARIKELEVQRAQITNPQDQAIIDAEISHQLAAIDQTANTSDFNGKSLLNSSDPTTLQVGDAAGDQITISASNATTAALGLDNLDLADTSSTLQAVEQAISSVAFFQGQLGASQNRLDTVDSQLNKQIENTQATRSQIEDVDFAVALAEKVKKDIQVNSGIAILAQANKAQGGSFSLLGDFGR